MESSITYEEAFHTEYRVFLNSVETLSLSAEKQCEIMGNYNVAWELKDDVSAGLYLIKNPASVFTEGQNLAIQQLINELNKIPESVLKAENTPEENLNAMKHPAWEPLRKQAVILLRTLESVTKNNEIYFN